MNEYISVIIPCYNVEKYLKKCVDSILNQSYKKIEIILIDDCSTDNTWQIIEEYAKTHKNIISIKNEKNSGAGYSRNQALKIAKYELVSFVDSDDYLEEKYYEEMLKTMVENKADVVICDIFVKYENVDGTNTRSEAKTDRKGKLAYIDNGLAASPCNKLFHKKDLLKYPFPERIMNEDIATVLPILINAKKISYAKDTYYNYIQRKSSVQNSGLNEKRFDLFKSMDILLERIDKEKDKEYLTAIVHNQITMFFFYVIPKEKNKKKRLHYLKAFNLLSEKYKIKQNNLYWNFLAIQGLKHKLYYKTLLGLNTRGFYYLSNELISFYDLYNAKYKKSVIKQDITLDSIKEVAKYQAKLKDNKYKLSVVIPNYNYERFLLQRVYSILYQKIKIDELIILDDCSSDNSRELIDKIEVAIDNNIKFRKVYNEKNSGTAFKQWKKGFKEASGDYVWIAEADDYCKNDFLNKVMKPIEKDNNIVISYSDTAFIDKNGYIIMRTIKPEIDILKTGHWNKSFVQDGKEEIKNHAYLNCTIANVSSVIFKKANYNKFFEEAGTYRQAGDWLFYLFVMSTGKIAFYNKPLNFYRVHGNNVTSQTKKEQHLQEIKKIHNRIAEEYGLSEEQKKEINERYKFLKKVWYLDEE